MAGWRAIGQNRDQEVALELQAILPCWHDQPWSGYRPADRSSNRHIEPAKADRLFGTARYVDEEHRWARSPETHVACSVKRGDAAHCSERPTRCGNKPKSCHVQDFVMLPWRASS